MAAISVNRSFNNNLHVMYWVRQSDNLFGEVQFALVERNLIGETST